MKHDATKKNVLYENVNTNYFMLKNSKLYFLVFDQYSEECSIASISTSGGSYTVYGKIPFYSEFLYVIGNRAYYYGGPYGTDEFMETSGLVEYDMSAKTYRLIVEDWDMTFFSFTSDLIIREIYENEMLSALWICDGNGNSKQFAVG